jgi:hypothetical protein
LSHHVGAKSTLRTFVFDSHKGVHTIEIFAARERDLHLAVIPEAFFVALDAQNHQLTNAVRSLAGEQLTVIARVARFMENSEPITITRPLSVDRIVEHQPRAVFDGDGTPEHPDRFDRDDFACLPFQLAAGKYAIAYYVVTQNIVHDWNPHLNELDPARYDMPEQTFDLTLANIRGTAAKVSAWDPISDKTIPVNVLACAQNRLEVQLPTADYPRFLIVEESMPGPLILRPRLAALPNGSARVSFQTSLQTGAKVSWGPWPDRNGNGSVDLPAGRDFTYIIPKLREHEGVKVTVSEAGLTSSWPRWDYDTEGVIRRNIADFQPKPDSVPPNLDRLPGLDQKPLPDAYAVQPRPGFNWKQGQDIQTMQIDSDSAVILATLTFLPVSSDPLSRLLPPISISDHCTVQTERVAGTTAWRIELTLDPLAHPSDKMLDKLIYLFPMTNGWLQLKFESDKLDGTTDSAFRRVVACLHFTTWTATH